MPRGRWVLAWVLAAGLVGCGGSVTEPELAARLVGDWSWVEDSGGIAGITLTPQSQGYVQTLRILPEGTLELLRDGVSVARTQFSHVDTAHDGAEIIRYEQGPFGFPSSSVVFLPGDSLLLIDPCCDGFTRRWVRRPGGA